MLTSHSLVFLTLTTFVIAASIILAFMSRFFTSSIRSLNVAPSLKMTACVALLKHSSSSGEFKAPQTRWSDEKRRETNSLGSDL